MLSSFLWTVVVISVSAMPLALSVWALLDCTRRPGWAWGLSGHDRVVWLTAILVGLLCVIGGVIVSGWYLLWIRPDVAAAEEGRIAGAG